MTISLVGSTINVSGGTMLDSRPFAGVTGTYTINAGDGNDQLVIDYTTPGVELKNVTFHGGNQADTLYVKGGSLGKMVYNYANATDGTIQNFTNPGDVTPLSTITYTGLSPIINTGTPTDIIFNLPGAADDAFLEEDGTPGNSLTRLRSNNGTFEVTTFANPAAGGSVTINAGNGDDFVTVSSPADFSRALTVNGDAGNDQVTFVGTASLAGLTGTAETFQLNSPTINTNGGPVTLNGSVNLGYAPQVLGDGPVAYWRLGETQHRRHRHEPGFGGRGGQRDLHRRRGDESAGVDRRRDERGHPDQQRVTGPDADRPIREVRRRQRVLGRVLDAVRHDPHVVHEPGRRRRRGAIST